MGLFNLFSKKDSGSAAERELGRLRKMVSNKLSQNMDRQDALHRLAEMGTPEAAEVLLTRFSWKLDPSITDQEEKELVVEGIAKAGTAALEPIRRFCARSESVMWPIKALRRIVPDDQLEQELLGLLDEFDTEYLRNAEPKVQLLQALQEFPTEDVRIAVEPFLSDVNEQVRFAAVTTVFATDQSEAVSSLVTALIEDESLRIKNRIAQGLAERGWPIPEELQDECNKALPAGFAIDRGVVRGTARL